MRRILAVAVLATGLLGAADAAAQPGLEISPPPPERLDVRPPRHERVRPDAVDDGATRGVQYDPYFVGPTLRTETTELGLSAWIAPSVGTGGPQPGGGDRQGWAALGLTFSWGGPTRRPSSGPAVP
jgi:hypothetical protein